MLDWSPNSGAFELPTVTRPSSRKRAAEHGVAVGAVVGVAQRPVAGVVGLAGLARADVLHQERHAREARLRLHALGGRERVVEEAHRHGAEHVVGALDPLARRDRGLARRDLAAAHQRRLGGGVERRPRIGPRRDHPLRRRG